MSKKIALVLSGGGARGFAHIGVINELERQNYSISSIAGTSMGALVGGMFASGQLEAFEEWVCKLSKKEILGLVDLNLFGQGFIKGEKIIEELKRRFNNCNIEDLPIPYCAVATDIVDEKEVRFIRGSLFDAIRASIAIPTVFTPYEAEGKFYVDGGLVNQMPINCVERTPKDKVVAVYVNAKTVNEQIGNLENKNSQEGGILETLKHKISSILPPFSDDAIGFFSLIDRSLIIMLDRIAELSIKENNPDILIQISRDDFGLFDFHKASEIVRAGELQARSALFEQQI